MTCVLSRRLRRRLPPGPARRSPPPFLVVRLPRGIVPLALLVLVAGAGCTEPADPVGEVALGTSSLTLPYPETRQPELTWKARRPLDSEAPWVFVHLLDSEGRLERTFDHPLPGTWKPGQEVSYPLPLYQSMLGPPLEPGEYRLTVGLYGDEGRWPLVAQGEDLGRQEYQVATVRVPAAQPDRLPRLGFVGDWTPLEPGADQQVLGARWLGAEGSIAVQEVEGPGRLGLLFETPVPPEGVRRVVEGPAEEPCLKITSTCDGSERRLFGTGLSRLEVEVPAGRPCDIRFEPNYHFADPDLWARSARLLRLTWDPREP